MRTEIGHDGRCGAGPRRECGSALQLLRPGMSFNEWTTLGCRLAHVYSASGWALGDWLLFGQRTFGQRYRTALRETNLDYQTLRNYAWVAGRFAPHRRRDTLSFQHHAEVASLPEVEQELWLRRAEAEHWSRNELRRRLRLQRSSLRPPAPAPLVMRFEVTPEDERRWRRAAAIRQLALQDWLRIVADAAATDELGDVAAPAAASVPRIPDEQAKHLMAG